MVTLKGRSVIFAVIAGFAFLASSSSVQARQHEQHGGAPAAPKAEAPAQPAAPAQGMGHGCMMGRMGNQAAVGGTMTGAMMMHCMGNMQGMQGMGNMQGMQGMQGMGNMQGMQGMGNMQGMQGMGNMQGCMGRMGAMGGMQGMAMGGANAPAADGMAMGAAAGADMEVFHYLAGHGSEIRRTIKQLPNGVETVTESDNAEVAGKLQAHVATMTARIAQGQGIHLRDPLFVEVFKNADKIEVKHEPTAKGIRVVETSSDPYVAKLIKAHAQVVSAFIKDGHAEMMKNHEVPAR